MNILITYDVDMTGTTGPRRLRKVAKACLDYGRRVQNSVFECQITEAQYVQLKSILEQLIDKEKDSILIYKIGNNPGQNVTRLGRETGYDINAALII